MARKVFFSFHYDRDAWRVSQVRNSWVTKPDHEASRFLDKAEWEAIERQGKKAVQNWIDSQLKGTSVTVILIGAETSGREWVKYEIKKSNTDGKGLLGIYIHNLKDSAGKTDTKGTNPFTQFGYTNYKTYVGLTQKKLSEYIEFLLDLVRCSFRNHLVNDHETYST